MLFALIRKRVDIDPDLLAPGYEEYMPEAVAYMLTVRTELWNLYDRCKDKITSGRYRVEYLLLRINMVLGSKKHTWKPAMTIS